MAFDLLSLAERVRIRAELWNSLGLAWSNQPISPNYGKPMTASSFEGAEWGGEISIWETGEAELATVRISDGWGVNKHYELTAVDDLDIVLDEITALVREGRCPPTPSPHGLETRATDNGRRTAVYEHADPTRVALELLGIAAVNQRHTT